MNGERVFSVRNPWCVAAVGGTVALTVVTLAIGFVWLPSVQRDFSASGVWAAICRAAGVPSQWYGGASVVAGPAPSDVVVLPPRRRASVDAGSIGRGATLATQHCSMCHGAVGLVQVTSPALAGQYGDALYKQLRDYRSGARPDAIMQPIIAARSEEDLRDLANYYASLPRAEGSADASPARPADTGDDATARRLAMQGDPLRNIAPCAACHGEIDRKGAAPWLGGQSATYLRGQLAAFHDGTRHNDINEQMRNVARTLTAPEIDALAAYYAAQK